ncbi:MAG: FkbM family methyltransferase [Treponema sp.]|jgi:FkbM family methyltransferase|nr:FkbM family methyltransferase [Treponema sp.]
MKSFEEEFAEIQQLCQSSEYIREVEQLNRLLSHGDLVLYGAGALGVILASNLKSYGIKAACFCDKNKAGTIEKESGLPIVSPQTLVNDYPGANIVISSSTYADEIKQDLVALGIASERIISEIFFNVVVTSIASLWDSWDVKSHVDDYKRAYGLYHDDISKRIMLERLKCHLTPYPFIPSRHALIAAPINQMYFGVDDITLSHDEVFVDGGMYTGDTTERFFKCVGSNYKHYYGFEPDRKNADTAGRNFAGKPDVTICAKGLWSSETRLLFSEDLGSVSHLNEMGDAFVDVTALDIYFSKYVSTPPPHEVPTLIKMDIEGAELEAVKGAEHIIREHKPKLAISVYHKPEDIYTLPEFIYNCRDDYKFYLRHYDAHSICETVLYAV